MKSKGEVIVGSSVVGGTNVNAMTGEFERIMPEPYSNIGQSLSEQSRKRVTLTLPLNVFTVVRVGYDDLAVSRPRKKKKTGPILIPGVCVSTGFKEEVEDLHEDDVLEEVRIGLPSIEDFPELFEYDYPTLESLLTSELELSRDELIFSGEEIEL